jgi:hypothetical protein
MFDFHRIKGRGRFRRETPAKPLRLLRYTVAIKLPRRRWVRDGQIEFVPFVLAAIGHHRMNLCSGVLI